MNYVNLGRTGLKISRLVLGTTNFGTVTDEETSHKILSEAYEHGLTTLDTADAYGYHKGKGLTETIIGRWFANNRDKRDDIVLATKVYTPMSDRVNDGGLSAYHIKRACEASLRRLQVDHIDVYQMHHIDRKTPWEEVWQAMEQLVREGKISYVGSSNFAGWHIAKAQERARQRNFMGLVSEQSLYNLVERTVELEVLPACEDYGVGFIPYSPVAGGVLAGALQKATEGRRSAPARQAMVNRFRPKLEKYEALCDDLAEHPADVALAWVLHQPRVTAPIIGPRTMEQLRGNLHALTIDFDNATLDELDEIWPGPNGEAPEAYAW